MDVLLDLFKALDYAGIIIKIVPDLRGAFDHLHINPVNYLFGYGVGIIKSVDIQDLGFRLKCFNRLLNGHRGAAMAGDLRYVHQNYTLRVHNKN